MASTYKNIPSANPNSVTQDVNVVNTPDVNVVNQIIVTPTGLRTDLSSQSVTVTDVPTKIPTTALTGRNGISVRIWGGATVYFGDSSVTVAQVYPKLQYEEIVLDITDAPAVDLWGICASGQTCDVRIMQIA